MIRVRVKPPDAPPWEATAPSPLTSEVERLSTWFDSLATGRTVDREEWFMEPNSSFEATERKEGLTTPRTYFELELRPAWAFSRDAGMRDLWLDLRLDRDELRAGATSLREELARFPPRGE